MPYLDPCCNGLHAFNHLAVSTQTGAAEMVAALFFEHQSAGKSCVRGSLSNASFRGVRANTSARIEQQRACGLEFEFKSGRVAPETVSYWGSAPVALR
jgi:hypothetical protein